MVFLIDDILLSPITLIKWVAEKINELVEQELTNESKVQEELIELQTRLELDEITEEEYQKREIELLERLETIRRMKSPMERRPT